MTGIVRAPAGHPLTTATTRVSPERLRLVVVGHVDHGKSTLIGRLLYDTGSLLDGKYEQLVASAASRGVPFEFAHLTDALQAERDQNVTIDTSQIGFRTARRQYVLIDAPGHREFIKNMVTGAAGADAALVIIDAQEGVADQSRSHGYLLKLLGIEQVAVLVNKLDAVGYSRETFERVAAEYREFLSSVGITAGAAVPISARHGDNVASRSPRMPWYTGGTVVDVLDAFATPIPDVGKPLRFAIQDVYRFDERRIVAGRVESGTLRVGDHLLFVPSGAQATVKTIERWHAPPQESAVAGDSIGLTFTEQLFLRRGEVASTLQDAPSRSSEFEARLFWLGAAPLVTKRWYRFRLATQEFDGEIDSIARVVDAATLAPLAVAGTSSIGANCVADVTIRTRQPVALDPYQHVPNLGRFVIVDGLSVSGGGVVIGAGEQHGATGVTSANITRSISQVSREQRHARNRHTGAVVWFTGLPGSGKSTLATALERELFDRGWQVFVLDGDNIRFGLSADLGFSEADRTENIRRVAEVARLLAESGVIAIAAFISPYRGDRLAARQVMHREGADIPFAEVYLSTPLDVCEARDPKGLYAKARAGEIDQFTGVSAPFEPPTGAELVIDTSTVNVDEALEQVVEHLTPRVLVR